MQSRLWPRLALLVFILLAVLGFFALGLHERLSWQTVRGSVTEWKTWADDNLIVALIVFFAAYVAVTALSLPVAVVMSLLAGALFGRWLGTLVADTAATCGATLAFLASRYLLRDWVQTRFTAALAPINRGVERDGAFYLFTLRLIPAVPFFLINIGMALTPIRVRTFAVVSWVGMLLGAFLFVNLGCELEQIQELRGLLSWQIVLALALVGVTPLALRLLMRLGSKRNNEDQ